MTRVSVAGQPIVSVVIPTFNRAGTLRRAVDSVLGQTFTDFELIVVDDGSTDDTPGVIDALGDPRVRYIRHDRRSGANAARNTGIRASRGDYVAFLDSDDTWAPGKLEAQLRLFRENPRGFDRLGVVLTGEETIDSVTGRRIGVTWPAHRGDVYDRFFSGELGGNRTLMVRRECFDHVGTFDEALPASQLWDMMVRIARHYRFDYVPEILAAYYVHDGPHIRVPDNIERARVMLLEKYGREVPHWRAYHARGHRTIGVHRLQRGDARGARHHFVRSLLAMPHHKTAAYLALACAPPLFRLLERVRHRNAGASRPRIADG